eukprot:12643624-Alexandrium_andersonii.AAC.1
MQGSGKEDADGILNPLLPEAASCVDLSDINGGAQFVQSTWLMGFGPAMMAASVGSQGAAQLRGMIMG